LVEKKILLCTTNVTGNGEAQFSSAEEYPWAESTIWYRSNCRSVHSSAFRHVHESPTTRIGVFACRKNEEGWRKR